MHFLKKLLLTGFFLVLCSFLSALDYIEIQKGDTIYGISKKYNIPVELILKYNKIANPDKLIIGSKIQLPEVYIINKGDTIYKISRLYQVSVDEICRYNNLSDPTSIKVGLKIIIPPQGALVEQKEESGVKPEDLLWPHQGKREVLDNFLKGVAIIGQPGDLVLAVAPGRVIWADPYRGFGKMIVVKGADNQIYIYAGNEKLLIGMGEQVSKGTEIAILGKNAHDGVAKVYFSIYRDGIAIDPESRTGK